MGRDLCWGILTPGPFSGREGVTRRDTEAFPLVPRYFARSLPLPPWGRGAGSWLIRRYDRRVVTKSANAPR